MTTIKMRSGGRHKEGPGQVQTTMATGLRRSWVGLGWDHDNNQSKHKKESG